MHLSALIAKLQELQEKFGDVEVVSYKSCADDYNEPDPYFDGDEVVL